ncbi:hypothetical protein CANARDRAFT_27163 [[Candida] arabinofermentans NRRL YB-2248]|uniref:Uncharacterized protein n=1 Tax=[Candida] arabinofermentans NRRL YB-2248 TaxID=983967 RepID=A0A1E4T4U5_9ASCO|nr:hypothetical protein CANARDRAFT_27163 [[Candida] arabinofermentans NRRL YB-2248]
MDSMFQPFIAESHILGQQNNRFTSSNLEQLQNDINRFFSCPTKYPMQFGKAPFEPTSASSSFSSIDQFSTFDNQSYALSASTEDSSFCYEGHSEYPTFGCDIGIPAQACHPPPSEHPITSASQFAMNFEKKNDALYGVGTNLPLQSNSNAYDSDLTDSTVFSPLSSTVGSRRGSLCFASSSQFTSPLTVADEFLNFGKIPEDLASIPPSVGKINSKTPKPANAERIYSAKGQYSSKQIFTPKVCTICKKSITRDMSRHLRTHEAVSRFRCIYPREICIHKTGQFNRPYDFKKHLLNCHFKFDDASAKKLHNLNDKMDFRGTCYCGMRFSAQSWLDDHILKGNGEDFKCQYLKSFYFGLGVKPPIQQFNTK